MKRRIVIFLPFLIAALCFLCYLLATHQASVPLTISFLGYTNVLNKPEIAAALGQDPSATFQISNRTSSPLSCHCELTAVCTNGLTSGAIAENNPVPAHGTWRWTMVVPAGTNGWHFKAVVSSYRPRPQWQWAVLESLRKIGFAATPSRGRKYSPVTNEWPLARN